LREILGVNDKEDGFKNTIKGTRLLNRNLVPLMVNVGENKYG
jgi:hypothetical protein